MNRETLVSVVVPCYNIEKYVEKCVDSILNQTYKNLEIILVDDGATDNTGKILDGYKDERIKVIHQKNAGLSAARNSGLKVATGKYICFIDGDDYIDKKYVETLLDFAEKTDSDITVCAYREAYEGSERIGKTFLHLKATFSGEEAVRDYFFAPSVVAVVAWNKLYKTELFKKNNLEYPVGKLYEDSYTTYKLFYHSKKVTYIDTPLYFYLQRQGSIISGKYSAERFDNMIKIIDETKQFFKDNGEYEKYKDDITVFEINCLSYGLKCTIKEKTYCEARKVAVERLKKLRKETYMMRHVSKTAKAMAPFLSGLAGKKAVKSTGSVPKKIHYCWFGKNPLPEKAQKCIASWKKYMPDYEIVEWNEKNFNIEENIYAKEAYENKRYAFVSDYARLKILYENGGIYFDTDVELLKPIPKDFLKTGFIGKEDKKFINTGLGFACKKGDKTIKTLLDDYSNIHFVKPDGSFDLTSCPKRNTESFKTVINSELKVLPKDYLNPRNYVTGITKITKNTISIHHSDASWWAEEDKELVRRRQAAIKENGRIIGDAKYFSSRIKEKIKGKK